MISLLIRGIFSLQAIKMSGPSSVIPKNTFHPHMLVPKSARIRQRASLRVFLTQDTKKMILGLLKIIYFP